MTHGYSLTELDAPDPPEPKVIPTVNRAFEARLRAAVLLLRAGGNPAEIRRAHGLIVLREARHLIKHTDEERSKARR